jgi:hypothetical protein
MMVMLFVPLDYFFLSFLKQKSSKIVVSDIAFLVVMSLFTSNSVSRAKDPTASAGGSVHSGYC